MWGTAGVGVEGVGMAAVFVSVSSNAFFKATVCAASFHSSFSHLCLCDPALVLALDENLHKAVHAQHHCAPPRFQQ